MSGDFSEFVVYADESGDHGLANIDQSFPLFALVFCVVRKEDYTATVVPAMQDFKFRFFGHDAVVLHEREIRRQTGHFAFLRTDPKLRNDFLEGINGIVQAAPIELCCSVIHKRKLCDRYPTPWSPYDISLLFCMERLLERMLAEGQEGKTVHVVFESRGRNEDAGLELEFRRIVANGAALQRPRSDFTKVRFEPIFAPKQIASTGLQLADLTARPIALRVHKPGQPNQAWHVIRTKLAPGGLKCFPS